ncbi:hypothetical protein T07_1372 [Trichinella nelsoni]|uniref:Uncharacterized protein n=1 Tax=Trichinella nelsoni TaxID=6336 RepID=A0A0V0SA95_9BILA|nr:hypothetical protein T07_1372 [Trichinella nelsoni]
MVSDPMVPADSADMKPRVDDHFVSVQLMKALAKIFFFRHVQFNYNYCICKVEKEIALVLLHIRRPSWVARAFRLSKKHRIAAGNEMRSRRGINSSSTFSVAALSASKSRSERKDLTRTLTPTAPSGVW